MTVVWFFFCCTRLSIITKSLMVCKLKEIFRTLLQTKCYLIDRCFRVWSTKCRTFSVRYVLLHAIFEGAKTIPLKTCLCCLNHFTKIKMIFFKFERITEINAKTKKFFKISTNLALSIFQFMILNGTLKDKGLTNYYWVWKRHTHTVISDHIIESELAGSI